MEQSRRRLRRLAIGVLHDTYLPSVEELLDVYFRVNRWNPEGLRALQGDVKTYAKRWVLKEIHELLEQKPPEVQIDPLVPTIKENKTTDKDAIRRTVDKAVLSAAQHDTSICPLVIYDYERYTPQSSSQDGKSKKVEPDKFNNNMRLALYAMSTTEETQYSDDMERFEYAVASLREHFVLLCKEKSTNRGQTTVYMKIQTEHALTYAGAVECLLHTTKTLLDRWLMLAKILKPQKLPRYSNGIIDKVWFHNQIQPSDERSNLNSWVVSARKYMDKQVQSLEKDIKELQQNKQKKWDLLWEGSFRDWIEKNLPPDSLVLSVWDKLMARAKENERTPENWDDVQEIRLEEEKEYNKFWDEYYKDNPPPERKLGDVSWLIDATDSVPEGPEKTWTRGSTMKYINIAEYYNIFFNEKKYSCGQSSDLEAKILLDLMSDTYLEAETKNKEQEISDLLKTAEDREEKTKAIDKKIDEKNKHRTEGEEVIIQQESRLEKGKALIIQQESRLQEGEAREGQTKKMLDLRTTLDKNKIKMLELRTTLDKNKNKILALQVQLKKLQKQHRDASLITDHAFVVALKGFGITKHSRIDTIKMQLERKQRELKNEVSRDIQNLVEEWRKYVTAMKDKQGGLDKANKEIQTLNTKLEHPELALGYWQRPAWGGCLFFLLVKHQPDQWLEEEVVLQWFEVKTKDGGKFILEHRHDKVTSDGRAYNYRLESSILRRLA